MFLNILLKKNERIKIAKDEMKKGNWEEEVLAAVESMVEQCSKIKTTISSGKIDNLPKEFLSYDTDY
ncbi:hypothetical protein K7432_018436 [Basidiobolus ranarum]|uniref:Uncharacterized protein n=1 Tax=Basidiobolus ranarum TaxID=34480 RepID=A0ABR2WC75_9FUNG